MAGFLFLSMIIIVSWAVMFHSPAFRWLFTSWPFFASLTVAAFGWLMTSCVLAILCWRNFNKGLAHYRLFHCIRPSYTA